MSILTITITGGTAAFGQTRRSEASEAARMVEIALQHIVSGADTSGTLLDANRVSNGSYTYTPSFSS